MRATRRPVFIRYWGSHFKSARHVEVFVSDFRPLVGMGWRCYLVLERLPDDTSWTRPLLVLGVTITCEPRPDSRFDPRCIARVFSFCRKIHATVFHCENIHSAPLLGATLAGVPVRFWTKRSMSTSFEEVRCPSVKERIAVSTRLSCWMATRVIAVSQAVKDELLSLGVSPCKVHVRHNPRRIGHTQRIPARSTARASLGFSAENVVILSIGHATPVKGWDILARAFAKVASDEEDARLLLVGSYTSDAEQDFFLEMFHYLEQERLTDKVLFTGHGDVFFALGAADLFAMPSRSEGFSVALIEALEAGLPCVASRVGIAEHVIRDGTNGYLVDRCDVDALAGALQLLVRDKARRTAFARNATVPASIPEQEESARLMAWDYHEVLTHKGIFTETPGERKAVEA